jgi:hypothetical protein
MNEPTVPNANSRRLAAGAAAVLALVLGGLFPPQAAVADSITADSLLQQSTLVVNEQSDVYSFIAPGPGTLVVQLSDIVWPAALQSLGLTINSPTSVMGSLSTDGTVDISVSHAGTYYADVTGQAGGALDLGLYSLSVDFIPQGAPVPLPGSLLLMLTGLALFGLVRALLERSTPSPLHVHG